MPQDVIAGVQSRMRTTDHKARSWNVMLSIELPDRVRAVVEDPKRVEVVESLALAPEEDEDFNRLAALAADAFDARLGVISLLGPDAAGIVGHEGATAQPGEETRFNVLARAVAQPAEGAIIIPDVTKETWFDDARVPPGEETVCFACAVPISINGENVGALAVFDDAPREATDADAPVKLHRLARLASSLITLKARTQRIDDVEQALRHAHVRNDLATEATNIASWVWDLASDYIESDNDLGTVFGIEAQSPLTFAALLEAIHPDDQQEVRNALDNAVSGGDEYRVEFRISATDRWLLSLGRVLERDAEGNPAKIVGANLDITTQKHQDPHTKVLLREINHRVNNTLAILQSLAAQTLGRAQSSSAFMQAFSGRLQALAAVHNLLSDHEWSEVGAHMLLWALIAPYAPDAPERVRVEGEDAAVGADEALGLALVVHELATNAAQHGALSGRTGEVVVTTTVEPTEIGETMHIDWQERGGPEVTPPQHQGFGSVLIARGLHKVVGSSSEIAYEPEGAHARIVLPLLRRSTAPWAGERPPRKAASGR